MGKLTEEEAKQFEALERKRKAPDPEPIGRHVNFSVDLGKKDQVELARKLGLIGDSDDGSNGGDDGKGGDGDEGGGGAGGRKPDKVPKRGGYFG